MTAPTQAPPASAAPLRSPLATPLFRALWTATIVSNIGTAMNDVGSAWLMTTLTPSALWVALIQAAASLPVFLFSLPAGALADVVDRRKLLLGAQLLILLAAATLAASTLLGLTTPVVLLALTAIMGLGAALSAPAFQAIVPDLVGRDSLADAVSLNSLGVNIARATGPALGGLIVAFSGPAVVYGLNAISIIGVAVVVARWRPSHPARTAPRENFRGAMSAGLRYARNAPALQTVLLRAVGFFLFSSALWALLPLVARRQLELGAAGFGALLGCIGAGAIAGAILLPRLRRHVSANGETVLASAMLGVAILLLAQVRDAVAAGGVLIVAGMGWISMLSSLNIAAQTVVPAWVKARAMAVYLLVFQGAMTLGSIVWGSFAGASATTSALTVAGVGLVLSTLLARWLRLERGEAIDLSPSGHWASPGGSMCDGPDRGPVMVMIEYQVEAAEMSAFIVALRAFAPVRRRDGGYAWNVYVDSAEPDRVVETFMVPSWREHLRQHERGTHDDRIVQEALQRQLCGRPPSVRHLIAPARP